MQPFTMLLLTDIFLLGNYENKNEKIFPFKLGKSQAGI